ncbi:MAG TPA: hypothetical protein P5341_10365, partial [Hyphomonas sp.]|nr:hypothetical protein [Hyphomonas sp.]
AAAGRAKSADAARATAATPEVMMRFIMAAEKHASPEPILKHAFIQRCSTAFVEFGFRDMEKQADSPPRGKAHAKSCQELHFCLSFQ